MQRELAASVSKCQQLEADKLQLVKILILMHVVEPQQPVLLLFFGIFMICT